MKRMLFEEIIFFDLIAQNIAQKFLPIYGFKIQNKHLALFDSLTVPTNLSGVDQQKSTLKISHNMTNQIFVDCSFYTEIYK